LGCSLSTVQLAAGDIKPNGYYNGFVIELMSGGASGNMRVITNYDNATNTATVSPSFSGAVVIGDTYNIYNQFTNFSSGNLTTGGSTSSVVLSANDYNPTPDYYNGYIIEITGGPFINDIRTISRYDTNNNTVYVSSPFSGIIGAGVSYNLYKLNNWTASIPYGTYTALELANVLNDNLNSTLGVPFGSEFQVGYVSYYQKFKFDVMTAGNTANFLFGSGSNKDLTLANIIGFQKTNTSAFTSILSTSPINLMGEDYIYLCIKDIGNLQIPNLQDAFARILFNSSPKTITYNSFISNSKIYKSPLSKLEKIDVRFMMENGKLYDFNGFKNSFTLEIYTINKN
jgi:hypothetical protein